MLNQVGPLSLKRLIVTTGALLLACAISFQSVAAANLANYGFDTAIDFSSSVTGVLSSTPGDVSFGAGVDVVSTGVGNPARALAFDSQSASSSVDLAAAIADNDYLTFTITPDAGTPLDLTSFQFDIQINYPGSVTDWALFADPNPGMTGTQVATGTTATPATPPVFETKLANLTGVGMLQNISSPVTLRLYFYGWTASSPLFRVDNVQLDGILAGTGTIPGDFDEDDDVDGADFLKWQRDGLSASDLLDWEAGFGTSGSPALSSASVPEPSSILLVVSAIGLLFTSRRPYCVALCACRWHR